MYTHIYNETLIWYLNEFGGEDFILEIKELWNNSLISTCQRKTRARSFLNNKFPNKFSNIYYYADFFSGGARGVMVIVAGCGHDDTSSSPGRAWLVLCEMQSVASRIWTRVTVSISDENNDYTTGTSKNLNFICFLRILLLFVSFSHHL